MLLTQLKGFKSKYAIPGPHRNVRSKRLWCPVATIAAIGMNMGLREYATLASKQATICETLFGAAVPCAPVLRRVTAPDRCV